MESASTRGRLHVRELPARLAALPERWRGRRDGRRGDAPARSPAAHRIAATATLVAVLAGAAAAVALRPHDRIAPAKPVAETSAAPSGPVKIIGATPRSE